MHHDYGVTDHPYTASTPASRGPISTAPLAAHLLRAFFAPPSLLRTINSASPSPPLSLVLPTTTPIRSARRRRRRRGMHAVLVPRALEAATVVAAVAVDTVDAVIAGRAAGAAGACLARASPGRMARAISDADEEGSWCCWESGW